MSWQIASTLVLGAVIVAGFGWYERSRPSARVLALVATLAALAALGRIAFAPLPNVKPTTDIVLISGYVLGGAPGFAVGAVAALTSNFFFGQGPWTPWQMVGWGLVGVLGAVLARGAGPRLGRVGLAGACAIAGVLYGVVMNISIWVTFSGDQTLAKLWASFATSVWFDAAHVVGNIAFALAFGPGLVRALQRFRTRLTITWAPAPAATALLLAALLVPAFAAPDAQARSSAGYLRAAQNRDGGFGAATRARSNPLHSGWAALGLAAAGVNPRTLHRPGGRTLIDYVRRKLDRSDVGELERTILVVRAAGLNPRRFGGHDLVRSLLRRQRADGSFDGLLNHAAFGVLALRAAGRSTTSKSVRRALRFVRRQQNGDGGFSYGRKGRQSDIDDTAAAIQALAAGGERRSTSTRRAVSWLRARQNADGGFPLTPGTASNAQSAAWAAQAFAAVKVDPGKVRRRGASRSPLGYIRSLTDAGGAVRYSRTRAQTPVWVTAQALLALKRKPFPLRPVR